MTFLDFQIPAILQYCHKETCIRQVGTLHGTTVSTFPCQGLFIGKSELWYGFERTRILRSNLCVRTFYQRGHRHSNQSTARRRITNVWSVPGVIFGSGVLQPAHKLKKIISDWLLYATTMPLHHLVPSPSSTGLKFATKCSNYLWTPAICYANSFGK